MKIFRIPIYTLLFFCCVMNVSAQKTEITISFTEQFFDALLDAVFQYSAPPEFPLAKANGSSSAAPSYSSGFTTRQCTESIVMLRENGGVRTAVKFRDGEIIASLAFRGNYNPPLIGCVPFAGIAETVLGLEFDRNTQRLVGRAKVRDVSLNGTGGVGGSLIARMVQGAIDRKINPIEIVRTDKVSFVVPMQNSSSIKMKATGFTHDIANGQLNVRVAYEFLKN